MYKKTILPIIICLFLMPGKGVAQNFIQESVGKSNKKVKKNSSKGGLFIPRSEWIGKKIIFLPKEKSFQEFGYQNIYSGKRGLRRLNNAHYKKLVGKTATIISIKYDDRVGDEVMAMKLPNDKKIYAIFFSTTIDGIAFLRDLKIAQQKFLGDTLYYVGTVQNHIGCKRDKKDSLGLCTYNAKTDQWGEVPISKFEPLKVINIVAGFNHTFPVRFVLKKNRW